MRLRHFDHDGRARFITFCIHNRLPLLADDGLKQIVVDTIGNVRKRYRLTLLGYVIMPEHVHLVVVPPVDVELGPVVGEIKRLSAKRIHSELTKQHSSVLRELWVVRNGRWRFALWQKRCFDHNCRSRESVRKCIDYCHGNPVASGLVSEPSAWLWSSYRFYAGMDSVVLAIETDL